MQNKSFVFIGDLVETDEELPFNLFEDFYLTKPSDVQLKFIKDFLSAYDKVSISKVNRYETSQKKLSNSTYELIQLEPSDYKYFIIEHSKQQAKQNLAKILALSSLNLTILFEAIYTNSPRKLNPEMPGLIMNQLQMLTFFHDEEFSRAIIPEIKKIKKDYSKELQHINSLLTNIDKNKFLFIDRAVNDFVKIKDISERSPFKILSCFAIFEQLITTSSRSKTFNDNSISNQLQKKLKLLNNQFQNKIDIQNYFKGSHTNTIETIISKLYQYRSDIAHGNLSDFESDLKILKNQRKNILPFLIDLLRQVLISSLEQPQLISDLKEC